METVPKDKAVEDEFDATELNLSIDEPTAGKPGVAGYDWAQHYDGDVFVHAFPNGTTVGLKPFGSIYSKTWLYKIRSLQTDVDIEFAAIDRGACDEAKAVLRELDDSTGDPLDDLFKAWAASATGRSDDDKGLTSGE